ncbi:MAG TPA: biotin-dependent carboxyltransferase family protein [Rhodanobacteraceae bacterium]|nr:biotin-dependent carboxyltransferase family protein [Rhodanobacteraceae bacterium]
MNVEVVKPGLLSTLQDRGRHGAAMLGVGTAGAMDDVALRLANALAGNGADAAALEITLIGPRLRFDAATTIALAGAGFHAQIGGDPVPMWQAVAVERGAVLDIGTARHGARAYLAIAGGFLVDATLGSASTDVNARLGGHVLKAGDRLTAGAPTVRKDASPRWSLDPRPWFDADAAHSIRLIRGTHFDALDAASRRALFEREFLIGNESNRVGFRLEGPALALGTPIEMVSEPLATGTLQLPPDGQPIALMVEHPTVGGYPRIGQVAAVDLPRLAQRRPGESVRFEEIDLAAAQTRYLERERALDELIDAIRERLSA